MRTTTYSYYYYDGRFFAGGSTGLLVPPVSKSNCWLVVVDQVVSVDGNEMVRTAIVVSIKKMLLPHHQALLLAGRPPIQANWKLIFKQIAILSQCY